MRYHAGIGHTTSGTRRSHYWNYMLIITIKQGKEKSLLGQSWIYASAIEKVEGKPQEKMKPGSTAIVQSSSKQFIARAAYNSKSQIRARIWSFKEDEPVDHALIKRRVKAAIEKKLPAIKKAGENQLLTLIKGEDEGLPGLVVQLFGGVQGYLICEFNAGGVDAWKVAIVQSLMASTGCANVYERCNDLMRKGEGLPLIDGALAGEEPPDEVMLTDNGVRYALDLKTGHKSKFR